MKAPSPSPSPCHPPRWWIDGLKALHPPVTQYAIVALDPQERDRLLALKQTVIHNAGAACGGELGVAGSLCPQA